MKEVSTVGFPPLSWHFFMICLKILSHLRIHVASFVSHFGDDLTLEGAQGVSWKGHWGASGPRPQKTTKESLFGSLLLDNMCDVFSYFCGDCFLHVFETSFLLSFWSQRRTQASNSKAFGCHLLSHSDISGKV